MSALIALAMHSAMPMSSPSAKDIAARLDAIAKTCGVPRRWLVQRGREIVFKGPPDGDPAKLECVMKKMSAMIDAANRGIGDAPTPKED